MKTLLPVVVMLLMLSSGCNEDNTGPDSGTGRVRMHLTDMPAQFDAVNIVVTRVEVHLADADSNSGWITVNSAPATYDLLMLTNGLSAVFADSTLPAGRYTQIRLLIGEGSQVIVGGVAFDLEIPSGMQSGLKLNHPFTVMPNSLYELTLDFDAERSIHLTGSGQYQLNPVIRVQANATSGTISGVVLPLGVGAEVMTTVGTDTVSTYADTGSGSFVLMALPEGVYDVSFLSSHPMYGDTTVPGIVVVRQQDTRMDTILLPGL